MTEICNGSGWSAAQAKLMVMQKSHAMTLRRASRRRNPRCLPLRGSKYDLDVAKRGTLAFMICQIAQSPIVLSRSELQKR